MVIEPDAATTELSPRLEARADEAPDELRFESR